MDAPDALRDPFGRPVDDLRVSLTPACDLACWFCHHEGMATRARLASADEIAAIVGAAARFGVRYVKLTGGEPLLRPDLERIVAGIAPLVDEVSLVTNGQRLADRAAALQAAGLRRVNVSVHTIDPAAYASTTGGRLEPVLRGVAAAVEAGLHPVKVNVVATRATIARLDELLAWARSLGVAVQLIEIHTPPGTPLGVLGERVALEDVERAISARASRVTEHRLHARRRYVVDGVQVEVTRPQGNPGFCDGCTRLRLTHDGFLKPCLMRSDNLIDVLGPLRSEGLPAVGTALVEATRRRAPFWRREEPALGATLPLGAAAGVLARPQDSSLGQPDMFGTNVK